MENLNEYISSERSFLHGISTPLMVAMSQLDFILAKQNEMSKEELIEKINKSRNALQKVSTAVHERRHHLKSLMNE